MGIIGSLPGEDPGGYYGQRALHGHQEVEGWQGWVRVLPVGAVARYLSATAKKSAPGQKLTKLTLDHVFFHACDRVG